jgi:hypothetical protein
MARGNITTYNRHVPHNKKPREITTTTKMRRCLGVLSTEEKGEHLFKSNGPHHRVCDECERTTRNRKVTTNKFNIDISKEL